MKTSSGRTADAALPYTTDGGRPTARAANASISPTPASRLETTGTRPIHKRGKPGSGTTAMRPKEASPLADDRLAARGHSPVSSGRLTAHYLHGMRAPFLDVAGGIAHLFGRRRADQHVQAERRQLTP